LAVSRAIGEEALLLAKYMRNERRDLALRIPAVYFFDLRNKKGKDEIYPSLSWMIQPITVSVTVLLLTVNPWASVTLQ
jgi:hypothetical protein